MKRPGAVTASAVVCLVGSVLVLAVAGAMAYAAFGPPPAGPGALPATPNMPDYEHLMLGGAVLLAVFGGAGVSAGIGLLKLRPWARVATLVFGGVMAALCLGAMVTVFSMPMPNGANIEPRVAASIRPILAVAYGIPLLIGVWWLVQFNRAGTKAAFGEGPDAPVAVPGAPPPRPLSISIIGWWLIVSGALSIMPAFSRMPGMAFGVLLTGWSATLLYVVFAAVQISAGAGLLKLQEPARVLALVWLAVALANVLFMAWRPGISANVEAYWRAAGTLPAGPPPFDFVKFMQRMTPFWIGISAVPIWFLVRHRGRFHHRAEP